MTAVKWLYTGQFLKCSLLSRDTAVSFAQSGLWTIFFLIELNLLCLTTLGTEHWRETCQDTTGTTANTARTRLNIALPCSTMALASSPCNFPPHPKKTYPLP